MQAYLLAAGRGRRAGAPKAWLESGGKPLLARQLEFALGRFSPGDLAVSVQKNWLDSASAPGRMLKPWSERGVAFVAVDPDASPLASLQALLHARPARSPFFVWHVDQPVWDARLFDVLALRAPSMSGHTRYTSEGARPVYKGKGGHPVLLSPGLGLKILALDPISERLDVFLKSRTIVDVPIEASCCVENWNTGAPGNSCGQESEAAR